MNGRVYDSELGRFMSADPIISNIIDSQNLNRYSYVQNNPMTHIDPSGYCVSDDIYCESDDSGFFVSNRPGGFGFVSIEEVAEVVIAQALAQMEAELEVLNAYLDSVFIDPDPETATGDGTALEDTPYTISDSLFATLCGLIGGCPKPGQAACNVFGHCPNGLVDETPEVETTDPGPTSCEETGTCLESTFSCEDLGTCPVTTDVMPDGTPVITTAQTSGLLNSIMSGIRNAANSAWVSATSWHFEGRDARNHNLPTYSAILNTFNSPWDQLPPGLAIFHDNVDHFPELKFIHPSGREVVFSGANRHIVTDDRYRGTYNYVNPAPIPSGPLDIGGITSYIGRGMGHLLLDVAPYAMGGNVRGPD